MTTKKINLCLTGDVEGELCEETGVDIVGALDIIGEVMNSWVSEKPMFATEKCYRECC